ncbi:MAG: FtsX-like permease family protein [Balneolaceae bacterium]
MYLKLAWRNIWRNKRRTLITVSSVMFAVIFALALESLEKGAHDMMIENMTRFHTGQIQLQDPRYQDEPSLDNAFEYDSNLSRRVLTADSRIDYLVPRIETFMLAAGDKQTRGAMVFGIDPQAEQQLNGINEKLAEGDFIESNSGAGRYAVIGKGLAERLRLSTGDTLALLGQGRFGMTASGLFEISGLIEHPMRDLNNGVVYLSLQDAQWLTSADGRVTSLLVMPQEVRHTHAVASALREELPADTYSILTWQQLIPDLLEALEFDRASTRLYMGILYIIIGFGIFGTILTMTLERLREFGLLISVGMKRIKLALVVFIETFLISLLGIAAGFAAGIPILWYFHLHPIEFSGDAAEVMADFGIDPILPASLSPDIFLWQGLIVFCITILICLYPSLKIKTLSITESSRK